MFVESRDEAENVCLLMQNLQEAWLILTNSSFMDFFRQLLPQYSVLQPQKMELTRNLAATCGFKHSSDLTWPLVPSFKAPTLAAPWS